MNKIQRNKYKGINKYTHNSTYNSIHKLMWVVQPHHPCELHSSISLCFLICTDLWPLVPTSPLHFQSLHLVVFSHFHAKSFMTELASRARTPSIEVTKGIKDACLASTASRYFFFSSHSQLIGEQNQQCC